MKLVLFVASTAANVMLVVILGLHPELAPPKLRAWLEHPFGSHRAAVVAANPSPAKPVTRPKLWTTVESDELSVLVARLRAAGFPPEVVAAVIQERVSQRYDAQLSALQQPDPNTPFWKWKPFYLERGRMEQLDQLIRERAKALRAVLDDDFFAGTDSTAEQRRRFGNLPQSKIAQLQRIEDDYKEMGAAITSATAGILLPEDTEKLALLKKEKQADLAAVLSPSELEEYQMRTSRVTDYLRSHLGAFDPSEAEFRSIYKAQLEFNDRFPSMTVMSGSSMADREAAQKQLQEQLKASLGGPRYDDYIRESDNEFQQLTRIAELNNVPKDAILRVYSLRDTLARESNRIFDDPSLTDDAKRTALQQLGQSTRLEINTALPPAAAAGYLRTAERWLQPVESGAAITLPRGPMTVVIGDNMMVSFSTSPNIRRLQNRSSTPPSP
jgi:hypothetical protein